MHIRYGVLQAVLLFLITLFFFVLAPSLWGDDQKDKPGNMASHSRVYLVKLRGSINPGAAELLKRALKEADIGRATCLVIELDTPGGLVSTLRDMVQGVMASPIPTVVYVMPSGAQAASAGAILTIAAHVAAMAHGTNIGAAHPVNLGSGGEKDETMKQKAENDLAAMARSVATERGRNAEWAEKAVRESVSASAREALELKVIDILAKDLSDLIQQLDGMTVNLPGGPVKLVISNPEIIQVKESLREKILRTIADPNIAYILMMIGMTGLYFEFAHPGTIFPGTIGAICLLLGLFALQALPVSTAGLLLLLLAVILFVMELVITSHGILGAAGLLALLLGSIMLFDSSKSGVSIDTGVLLTTLLGVGSFLAAITYLATRATLSRPKSGAEGLIGEKGIVRKAVGKRSGQVFLHGELWTAVSDETILVDTEVKVIDIEGLKLRVSRTQGGKS
ncbi:MAG: nodulation protein NfeD [Deltaproteobacteria bacterium]|nr:nodulation protein NfeD [Deltaproteobacteria bacterium]MDL1961068.1 nodulation protein NfeD [Deltaproteobacteria bacterium]